MGGIMIRGTNPTIRIKLPTNISLDNIENLQFVLDQDTRIIKYLDDMTIDRDGNRVMFDLTLEETMAFTERKSAKWEVRFKLFNGKYIKSKRKSMPVLGTIEGGRF